MEVLKTDDYSQFNIVRGNRAVDGKRKKKIADSIEKVGYIPSPIIVNENMEIIDGQGRFAVCKDKGLPIYYMVVPGIGLKECISMNISSTSWTMLDYVKSFAEQGSEDYKRLENLLSEYPGIPQRIVITAATNSTDTQNDKITSGTFKLSSEGERNARAVLDYIMLFVPIVKERAIPNAFKLYQALCFTYWFPEVDNDRMLAAVDAYSAMLGGYSNVEQTVEALERVYNHRLGQKNKVLVYNVYRSFMASKSRGYEARHHGGKKVGA